MHGKYSLILEPGIIYFTAKNIKSMPEKVLKNYDHILKYISSVSDYASKKNGQQALSVLVLNYHATFSSSNANFQCIDYE